MEIIRDINLIADEEVSENILYFEPTGENTAIINLELLDENQNKEDIVLEIFNQNTDIAIVQLGERGLPGIDGKDGENGLDGADGQTFYTWVKYADTPTSGISDNPAGKNYLGIAVNKTTAIPSEEYGDYQWSLINAAALTDKNFIYEQSFTSGEWTVQHFLNKYPSVIIVEGSNINDNNKIVTCEIQYLDVNTIILKFSIPIYGFAILN